MNVASMQLLTRTVIVHHYHKAAAATAAAVGPKRRRQVLLVFVNARRQILMPVKIFHYSPLINRYFGYRLPLPLPLLLPIL